ncbi:MAG: hypothetical protein J1E60_01225 [Christensenellaceae bacterium]|nr:hypothetical protein [Christensenellaceae bacterium]
MLRQIRLLTVLGLRGLFGLNEARYTNDKKRKRSLTVMVVAYAFIFLMLIMYVAGLSSGLAKIGLSEIIPQYLYAASAIVVLLFSMFSAGNAIFGIKNYETLITLPVKPAAVVTARFLTMYVMDLIMSIVVMLPGLAIYFTQAHSGFGAILLTVIGVLFLPLLPLTIATAIGAGITYLTSKLRHKSIISAAITILVVIAVLILNPIISTSLGTASEAELTALAANISGTLGRVFPPSIWFNQIAVRGSFGHFVLLFGGSSALFALVVYLLQRRFGRICAALNTSVKRGGKVRIEAVAPMRALVGRELKRYFASSIYVMNTLSGYILMMLAPIALLFVDISEVENAIEMTGIVSKLMPFVLSMFASMMPITCCSVSMEGKSWWIAKSLPITDKMILDSKILLNLLIVAPCWLIASVFGIIAVKPDFLQAVWILLIPALYIVCSAVIGIGANLAFPKFDWDNEARVVKQGAAALVAMLSGMVLSITPLIVVFALGGKHSNLVMGLTAAVLVLITSAVYLINNKRSLIKIN